MKPILATALVLVLLAPLAPFALAEHEVVERSVRYAVGAPTPGVGDYRPASPMLCAETSGRHGSVLEAYVHGCAFGRVAAAHYVLTVADDALGPATFRYHVRHVASGATCALGTATGGVALAVAPPCDHVSFGVLDAPATVDVARLAPA